MKEKLWYFAHGYTGNEEKNYEDSNRKMQVLLDLGYNVISPITATHMLHKEKPRTYDFWMKLVSIYLSHCDGIILDDDTWTLSSGCNDEFEQSLEEKKEILLYKDAVSIRSQEVVNDR